MEAGTPLAGCSLGVLSESSGQWFTHENPRANPPGVFLCIFTNGVHWSRFPGMELGTWLAREQDRDRDEGLQPTLSDPTALGLLALALSEARKAGQPPRMPQVPR
jgi:hypothetical protein